MKTISVAFLMAWCAFTSFTVHADKYDRNTAVPVQKVLFGKVQSVRQITYQEIITDKASGGKIFGGALLGGLIGSQFGDGSGQTAATILGALIGGNVANNKGTRQREKITEIVELMILTENDGEFMVVQDLDPRMLFKTDDRIRLIYLGNGSVRVDKQY